MGEIKEIWTCTVCNHETPPLKKAVGCPNCGSKFIPLTSKNDVHIKINTQELRIILTWAEFWADEQGKNERDDGSMRKVVANIANKLRPQLPEANKSPLTFSQEFDQLKEAYPNAETNFPTTPTPDRGDK